MKSVSVDQGDLPEEIRALADDPRLHDRSDQLRRLADDLAADHDLARWAQMSLHESFLRGGALPALHRSAREYILDQIPGVLIFLPILSTWYGLQRATSAYRQSRGDSALAGMSFLEQWQTGFNGKLATWLYFDRVASWTLVLIVTMIGFSVWRSVAQRGWEARDVREREQLLARLANVISLVDFELAQYRMSDAAQLATYTAELRATVAVISESNETARTIFESARHGLEEVRSSLAQVNVLASAMLTAETATREAAVKLAETTVGADDRLLELAAAADAVAAATADLTRTVTADSAQLRGSVQKAVGDSATELRTAVADSTRGLGTAFGDQSREFGLRMGDVLSQAGDDIREALDKWRTEGAIYSHRHESTADRVGQFAAQLEALLDRVTQALDGVPQSVQRLEQNTGQSIRALDATLNDGADRMQGQLTQFLVGLPDAQARTDQVTREMGALRIAIERLNDQLNRLPDTIRAAAAEPRRRVLGIF
jgi:hypothetical protein